MIRDPFDFPFINVLSVIIHNLALQFRALKIFSTLVAGSFESIIRRHSEMRDLVIQKLHSCSRLMIRCRIFALRRICTKRGCLILSLMERVLLN